MVEVEVVDDGQQADAGGGWEAELASQRDVSRTLEAEIDVQV